MERPRDKKNPNHHTTHNNIHAYPAPRKQDNNPHHLYPSQNQRDNRNGVHLHPYQPPSNFPPATAYQNLEPIPLPPSGFGARRTNINNVAPHQNEKHPPVFRIYNNRVQPPQDFSTPPPPFSLPTPDFNHHSLAIDHPDPEVINQIRSDQILAQKLYEEEERKAQQLQMKKKRIGGKNNSNEEFPQLVPSVDEFNQNLVPRQESPVEFSQRRPSVDEFNQNLVPRQESPVAFSQRRPSVDEFNQNLVPRQESPVEFSQRRPSVTKLNQNLVPRQKSPVEFSQRRPSVDEFNQNLVPQQDLPVLTLQIKQEDANNVTIIYPGENKSSTQTNHQDQIKDTSTVEMHEQYSHQKPPKSYQMECHGNNNNIKQDDHPQIMMNDMYQPPNVVSIRVYNHESTAQTETGASQVYPAGMIYVLDQSQTNNIMYNHVQAHPPGIVSQEASRQATLYDAAQPGLSDYSSMQEDRYQTVLQMSDAGREKKKKLLTCSQVERENFQPARPANVASKENLVESSHADRNSAILIMAEHIAVIHSEINKAQQLIKDQAKSWDKLAYRQLEMEKCYKNLKTMDTLNMPTLQGTVNAELKAIEKYFKFGRAQCREFLMRRNEQLPQDEQIVSNPPPVPAAAAAAVTLPPGNNGPPIPMEAEFNHACRLGMTAVNIRHQVSVRQYKSHQIAVMKDVLSKNSAIIESIKQKCNDNHKHINRVCDDALFATSEAIGQLLVQEMKNEKK